uniref:MABP domain-containing protein n=2 Tax=Ditylenchus dipsaci TaxID=166011 RepID=A0A915EIM2_9BILA
MLFLSGMDVTVVNDRTEDYTRGQMLTLDGRWTNQMNWLLGTQFDQMLEGEDAVGKKFPELYKVQMGLKYLEDALKHRLATLVSYVESQNEGSIFQLFYEVAFEKVQFPNETDRQFKALLKPSDKCLVKGKVVSLRCSKTVVFDVLASVGGAADSTRDTYIGIPREYTIPKRFATSTFRRGANLKKVQFLPLPLEDMEKLIKENEFVPELLKDKYRNLTKHILQGFQGDSDSQIDESFQDATYATRDLETEQFYLPAFENYKCLSLGVVVEKALDLFFTDVEARIKTAQLDNDMKEARSLRTLKDRVLRKFLTALTLKLIRTAHNEKYIDCTSNEMFRIRPAVGILEPQRNEDVKVIFNACKILPEDSKHHSVVYHISAKNDVSVKKRRMYGELRGTIGNYYSCGAYKGTPTAALIPSPVASTPDESNLVVGSIRVSIDHDPLKNWQLQSRQCIIISSKDPVRSLFGCRILYKKRGQ